MCLAVCARKHSEIPHRTVEPPHGAKDDEDNDGGVFAVEFRRLPTACGLVLVSAHIPACTAVCTSVP